MAQESEFDADAFVQASPFPKIVMRKARQNAVNNYVIERMRVGTNYKKRLQNDPVIIKKQIREGKVGEWVVYDTLTQCGYPWTLNKPDMNVYPASQKSYSPDMDSSEHTFFIKARRFTTDKKYMPSWLFQWMTTSESARDEVYFNSLGAQDCFTCCVFVNIDKTYCGKMLVLADNAKLTIDDFGKPYFPKYWEIKKALYYQHLSDRGLVPGGPYTWLTI